MGKVFRVTDYYKQNGLYDTFIELLNAMLLENKIISLKSYPDSPMHHGVCLKGKDSWVTYKREYDGSLVDRKVFTSPEELLNEWTLD